MTVPSPAPEGVDVALRVSGLPGGESFTITALYDPTGPAGAPYVGEDPPPVTAELDVQPSATSSTDALPDSSPVPTAAPAP